ncbi:hypothetical protein MF672_024675 [Actinomadura sp. ATCC 31491]|uniref:Uncharacterized protein n=1 Tax=Actinomadura luzonensis TaxID=2805427 RepID=A0ABT0FXA3_9ACTN|nr:hypothetical protein [Actinomadura luzonensis]MCK2216962.1 hypothetical protein [Actinomadura luzonensis]
MNRTLRVAATAALLVTGSALAAPPASASSCSIQPYGLIGDYWRSLGGADAIIGCPTGEERGVPNREGRRQTFDDGQIAWSPDQGPKMMVAAYSARVGGRNGLVFRWGPTSPFSYDYYRVTLSGGLKGELTVRDQPRIRGRLVVYPGAGKRVSFTVMGCDDKFPSDTCRQGWTVWVAATSR